MVNCIRVASGAVGLSDMDSYSKYHGYIYEAVSGDNYSTSLYTRPDAMSSSNGPSTSPSTNETYIFAVNKTPSNGLPLEVRWSHEVSQEAMPDPLWFPAWVQRYQFHWPTNAYSVPQIVLASELGSANLTLSEHGAAVDFSQSQNSRMKVADGNWFAGDTYTVECWVKPNNLKGVNGRVFDLQRGMAATESPCSSAPTAPSNTRSASRTERLKRTLCRTSLTRYAKGCGTIWRWWFPTERQRSI